VVLAVQVATGELLVLQALPGQVLVGILQVQVQVVQVVLLVQQYQATLTSHGLPSALA
jgi:hypothetical protein